MKIATLALVVLLIVLAVPRVPAQVVAAPAGGAMSRSSKPVPLTATNGLVPTLPKPVPLLATPANLDLQQQLAKQQQALQMLSAISKQLNDTAAAVIRNLR